MRSTGAKKSSVAKMAWAPNPAEARLIRVIANSGRISGVETILAIHPKMLLYRNLLGNKLCTPA